MGIKKLLTLSVSIFTAYSIFSMNVDNDFANEKPKKKNIIHQLSYEHKTSLDFLPDDVLRLIFMLVKDIKSTTLSEDKQSEFRIDIDSAMRTFHQETVVALLPLVCRKFNHLIKDLRHEGAFIYVEPKPVIIPYDRKKITAIAKVSLISTVMVTQALSTLFYLSQLINISYDDPIMVHIRHSAMAIESFVIVLGATGFYVLNKEISQGKTYALYISPISPVASAISLVLLGCSENGADASTKSYYGYLIPALTNIGSAVGIIYRACKSRD